VLNLSFETAGTASWTTVQVNPGNISFGTSGATDGANGFSNSSYVDLSYVLYQDVVFPATGTYTFQGAIDAPSMGSGASSFIRADITNTNAATIVGPTPGGDTLATTSTADVLQNIYSRDGVAGFQAQADTAVVDISGLAGQTVRVRFMVQLTTGAFDNTDMRLDNARLIRTAAVVAVAVLTLSEWSMVLLASLMALFGIWHMRRRHD
jgi:hypothetical protein